LSDIRIFPAAKGKAAGMMIIDATVKTADLDGFIRPWPNATLMNEETISKVDKKWAKYDVGPLIPSPSLKYSGFYQDGAVRKTKRL